MTNADYVELLKQGVEKRRENNPESVLDLAGTILSGADFTDTHVTGTIFGNNLGLTESDKLNLKKRGAIFQDPPTSDVPSLVSQ